MYPVSKEIANLRCKLFQSLTGDNGKVSDCYMINVPWLEQDNVGMMTVGYFKTITLDPSKYPEISIRPYIRIPKNTDQYSPKIYI